MSTESNQFCILTMEPATAPAPRLMSTTKRKQPCTRLERPWIRHQLLLDTAIDALKMATAEAKAATHHAKILEEEHGHLVREFGFSCVFKHASASLGNKYQQIVANTLDSNHVSMYFQELMIQKLSPQNAKLYYDMEDGRGFPQFGALR